MNLLVINSTYTTVEAAFTSGFDQAWQRQPIPLELAHSIKHVEASTKLIPMVDELLNALHIKLQDISAIAVNQGPGPFTTMRSVIATINGLGFASGIPLIAVNGIKAFVQAHHSEQYTHTIALLNAFCNDVYYAQLDGKTKTITFGCCSILYWIEQLKDFLSKYPHARVNFIGNGIAMHQAGIANALGANLISLENLPEAPDVHAIAQAAITQWQENIGFTDQIAPLYFKAYLPKN